MQTYHVTMLRKSYSIVSCNGLCYSVIKIPLSKHFPFHKTINCVKRKPLEASWPGFARVPKLPRQNSEIDNKSKLQWNTFELINIFYLTVRLNNMKK